jgi:cell division protein ZapA
VSARRPPRPSITVEIAGEKHILRSEAPAEYTVAVAQHVDGTVRSLMASQPLEPHRAAVLAALHITDELFRAREELRQLRERVSARAASAADRLEEALGSRGEALGDRPPRDTG